MKTTESNYIFYTCLKHEEWQFYVAATKEGLCYVGSQRADKEELAAWARKRLPNYKLVEDADKVKQYTTQLIDYLEGRLKVFTTPIDLHGTSFQQIVWKELRKIDYGQTVSYTRIGEDIGKPNAVRAVGTAVGANPVLIIIPCHRVIAKSGKLTGYRGGLDMKERLLKLENSI